MISPKERLNRILDGAGTDRPACICPGGMMNMITQELVEAEAGSFREAHHDPVMMARLSEAVYRQGCFENYGVPFCMTVESEGFGAQVDFGTQIHEPHVVRYAIDSVTQWGQLPPLDFSSDRSRAVLEAIGILKSRQDGVPVIGNVTGPVSTASSVMEPVVFYKELRKKRAAAHEMMAFVAEQTAAFAVRQVAAGADVIALSDPSGTGEILGPALFREFAAAYINRVTDAVRACGGRTIVHICGQMKNVYPEVREIRCDALSFDAIVSLREARENLPGRRLMGNVSTYAIAFAEPSKIAELTRKCARDGAGIVAPACGLSMRSPLRNVQAMLEALRADAEAPHA